MPSADDDLLAILLRNLRNTAATFGEGTPPYESVRSTVEDHLQSMKAKGSKTNLTNLQRKENAADATPERELGQDDSPGDSSIFANLAFRPKPRT